MAHPIRAERGWWRRHAGLRLQANGPRSEERPMNATEVFDAIRAFGEHEHRDLARGLDRIHSAACRLGSGPHIDDVRAIRDVLRWTVVTLQPHIAWEETWLYPQIETITRTVWSTRAARFDHASWRTWRIGCGVMPSWPATA
jgi:hypothetical protein